MASLVSWLAFSGARDSTGAAVALGSAYFYEPGSVVQVPVYSDAEEETAVSQPVALDASGRATVYVDALCDIEIQTSAGVSLGVVEKATQATPSQVEVMNDGYTGIRDSDSATVLGGRSTLEAVLNSGAESIGSDLKYKESAIPTAVQRNVKEILGRAISPMDFGAAADGITDDSNALQMAINRAMATSKRVYLDAGTYLISESIEISGSESEGLIFEGAGQSVAKILNAGDGTDALSVNFGTADPCRIVLRDFSITASAYTAGTGIELTAATGVVCERITVEKHLIGFDGSTCSKAIFNGCFVSDPEGAGDDDAYGFELGAMNVAEACHVTADPNAITAGFLLYGAFSQAVGCTVTGVEGAESASGFVLAAQFSTAISCRSDYCISGFSVDGSSYYNLIGCLAENSTTGFNLAGAIRCTMVACQSLDAGTADLATAATTWQLTENGCTFTTRTIDAGTTFEPIPWRAEKFKSTTAVVNAGASEWTPDATSGEPIQRFIALGSSGDVALTVNATTGGSQGQRITLMIYAGAAASGDKFGSVTWDASYRGMTITDVQDGEYAVQEIVNIGGTWTAAGVDFTGVL